ncbi:unnamed protein product [Euphydryas editha]|uniref:Uncharacterized protein n=1 Tax=Euphydryas editha TaxID=104508 RepID=A0AAU9V2M7_EUPED|nr:unnamed protein product [Euphydryas editha]
MRNARGRLAYGIWHGQDQRFHRVPTQSSTSDDDNQTPLSTAESEPNDADSPARRSKRRRAISLPPACFRSNAHPQEILLSVVLCATWSQKNE